MNGFGAILRALRRVKLKISEGAQSAGTLETESEAVAVRHGFYFGAEVWKVDGMQNISGEERIRWLKHIATMNMQVPMPRLYRPDTKHESPLDRMLERLEWENSHCWTYKILHWREKPEYKKIC